MKDRKPGRIQTEGLQNKYGVKKKNSFTACFLSDEERGHHGNVRKKVARPGFIDGKFCLNENRKPGVIGVRQISISMEEAGA